MDKFYLTALKYKLHTLQFLDTFKPTSIPLLEAGFFMA